ncbi:MAG: hypothetical protein JRI36_12155 [Deltaproteobacteria bacterium]|nr:hypothetical protein [Deltaproteobacteria bacterium]
MGIETTEGLLKVAAKFKETLGCSDIDLQNFFSDQLSWLFPRVFQGGQINKEMLLHYANVWSGLLHNLKPQDVLETMLLIQGIGLHNLMIESTRRAMMTSDHERRDMFVRQSLRLSRTFAGLIESLKKYRSGGQQKIRIEHVTVKDGGQAMLGNIKAG